MDSLERALAAKDSQLHQLQAQLADQETDHKSAEEELQRKAADALLQMTQQHEDLAEAQQALAAAQEQHEEQSKAWQVEMQGLQVGINLALHRAIEATQAAGTAIYKLRSDLLCHDLSGLNFGTDKYATSLDCIAEVMLISGMAILAVPGWRVNSRLLPVDMFATAIVACRRSRRSSMCCCSRAETRLLLHSRSEARWTEAARMSSSGWPMLKMRWPVSASTHPR